MRRLRLSALAAILAFAGLACARGVALNPEPGQSYAVTVVNELAEPLIVSFDDGTTTRLLGTVGADRRERFVLGGAERETVTIVATDEAETRTIRRTVTLRAGSAVEVRLN